MSAATSAIKTSVENEHKTSSPFDTARAQAFSVGRREFFDRFLPDLVRRHGLRTALDVGCGFGYFSGYLKGLGLQVTTIDGVKKTQVKERKGSLGELCTRSLKYLMLVMGPGTLILVLLARDILRIWLAAQFAAQSALIFQIFAIGFLMNALACPPTTVLLAVGRPDIMTTCYSLVLILLLHAGLAWALIHQYGLLGNGFGDDGP